MKPGPYHIDDLLTFTVNIHNPETAGEIDADELPTWRLYKEETATPILTGSMALLDDANTTGFYSEQITLSAANGFEIDKDYEVRIRAIVNGVPAVTIKEFRITPTPENIFSSFTIPELEQGETPAEATPAQILSLVWMLFRNNTQTTRGATKERRIKNDAGDTILIATTTDDGNIFDQGKLEAPE